MMMFDLVSDHCLLFLHGVRCFMSAALYLLKTIYCCTDSEGEDEHED